MHANVGVIEVTQPEYLTRAGYSTNIGITEVARPGDLTRAGCMPTLVLLK